jgi:hypothetical protein
MASWHVVGLTWIIYIYIYIYIFSFSLFVVFFCNVLLVNRSILITESVYIGEVIMNFFLNKLVFLQSK